MNNKIIKFLAFISLIILFSILNLNLNLLQSSTLKNNLISGDFKSIEDQVKTAFEKAILINPSFNEFKKRITQDLEDLLNNWQEFLVYTSKNKILIPHNNFFKINQSYIDFIKKLNQSFIDLNQQIQSLLDMILNPKFKFQDSYLVNSNLYENLESLKQKINKFQEKTRLISNLAGIQKQNNILILLQNDYESRATGGFISAVIDIEVFNGEIKNFNILDIYEIDGQLIPDLDSPIEFKDTNPKLFIRDSNYNPDFTESALLVDRQIQKAVSRSYDFIGSVNLSFLNENIPEPIDLKYQYTYKSKDKLKNQIPMHLQQFLKKVLNSPEFLAKSFRSRDIQLMSKDPNLNQILKDFDFHYSLNENLITISKSNVNGFKSFFDQDSKINLTVDHSKFPVEKHISITSNHPYTNDRQIYLESVFKQLGINNKDDLFSSLKKEVLNYYRIYTPELKSHFTLLKEHLTPNSKVSVIKHSFKSNQKQFDFKEQIEVIGYKHYKDISLNVILPSDKDLFSPLFEYEKIKENVYEIPFDSEFIVVDKNN